MKEPVFVLKCLCNTCGNDNLLPDGAELYCHYCDGNDLKVVERKEATAELIEERLKQLTERMMSNLSSAYNSMTEEDKAAFPQGRDAEKELLELLAKAKEFNDKIQQLKLNQKD